MQIWVGQMLVWVGQRHVENERRVVGLVVDLVRVRVRVRVGVGVGVGVRVRVRVRVADAPCRPVAQLVGTQRTAPLQPE